MEVELSQKIFEKHQTSNFTKIHPVGAQCFHEGGRADGRTDMTKMMVAFRNFANAPKNSTFFPRSTFLSSFITLQLFPYAVLTDWSRSQNSETCVLASTRLFVRLSVHPYGTTRVTLDGFSKSLIFQNFSNIRPENTPFIKI
jgi:hypothetical protein